MKGGTKKRERRRKKSRDILSLVGSQELTYGQHLTSNKPRSLALTELGRPEKQHRWMHPTPDGLCGTPNGLRGTLLPRSAGLTLAARGLPRGSAGEGHDWGPSGHPAARSHEHKAEGRQRHHARQDNAPAPAMSTARERVTSR